MIKQTGAVARAELRAPAAQALYTRWTSVLLFAALTGPARLMTAQAKVPSPAPPPAKQAQTAAAPAKPISKEQAKELLDSVDQILKFASEDSGLPASAEKVKRHLVTRDEVTRYLVKSFDEDDSAKRLQRSEIVLKKFGLLNRDFDLRPFLLSLLTEQIAGYYDDKLKTVNLLDWVDPEEQKPVLAHELTHALQDQKVGLEKWSVNGYTGVSKGASEDNQRLHVDELETARQAVAEGQAMVVFVDYTLKPAGQTLLSSPEIADKIKEATTDTSGSPIMARAPLLLQRSLLFPYSDGLAFEQALLVAGGKAQAFAGALSAPPSSSFEIMNPQAYLRHVPPPVLRLPDVHAVLDVDYAPYDVGVMGELDVEMMAGLFGGPEMAPALAAAWDGGVYYAAQKRSATAAEKTRTGSLGLIYYSEWRSPEAARGFEAIYVTELGRKYTKVTERQSDEAPGETIYATEEGDVLLTLSDTGLFISEGFPLDKARRLRDSVTSAQLTGPVRLAEQPGGELTLGAVQAMGRLGMMKAGLAARR